MRSGELMALDWGDIDEERGIIRVAKSFNKRLKTTKCPKNGTWRNVDINSQLAQLIIELKTERRNETHILPQFPEWKNGQGGKILRMILVSMGIQKEVVIHPMRIHRMFCRCFRNTLKWALSKK